MKEYSGPGTLAKLSDIIKAAIAGKQDVLTTDGTVTIKGNEVGVKSPVQGVYTQAEFDALPEETQNCGMFVISDGGSGGSSGRTGSAIPAGGIIIWSGAAGFDKAQSLMV